MTVLDLHFVVPSNKTRYRNVLAQYIGRRRDQVANGVRLVLHEALLHQLLYRCWIFRRDVHCNVTCKRNELLTSRAELVTDTKLHQDTNATVVPKRLDHTRVAVLVHEI